MFISKNRAMSNMRKLLVGGMIIPFEYMKGYNFVEVGNKKVLYIFLDFGRLVFDIKEDVDIKQLEKYIFENYLVDITEYINI